MSENVDNDPAGPELGKKTARGSMWAASSTLGAKLLAFLAMLILARLLGPEEFGIVALAILSIGFLDSIKNLGVGEALVLRQNYSDIESNTAFFVAVVTGVGLGAIGFIAAPMLSNFFSKPEVSSLIRVLSVLFFVEALGAIHAARAQRDLNFSLRARVELSKALVKGIVSIVLALAGFGYWSLVIALAVGTWVPVIIYWRNSSWRPTSQINFDSARGMTRDGLVLVAVGVLAFLTIRADQFVIARRLDATALGYYTLSFSIATLLITNISQTVGQAVYATFAKLKNDMKMLRKYYLETVFWCSLFAVALGAGLYVTAPYIVDTLLAEKWLPIVPVLQALAFHGIAISTFHPAADLLAATGRARYIIVHNIIFLLLAGPLVWFLAPSGIATIAWGVVFLEVLSMVYYTTCMHRLLQAGMLDTFKVLIPVFVAAVCMVVVLKLLNNTILHELPGYMILLLNIVVGGIIYGAVIHLARPATLTQMMYVLGRDKKQLVT